MSAETIAAIATAPGRGGVAVIRVSGDAAFAVANRLAGKLPEPGRFAFRRLKGGAAGSAQSLGATRSSPLLGGGVAIDPRPMLLDEALVLVFKAPHSYTGEDVVEFHCHGGTVTPRRVLEACFAAGARPARRGEFTERAFLNGKLDYDQAESVLDLIDAKTDRAADAALEGLAGRKRRDLRALYDAVLALSSTVEHALDVDEGELPPAFIAERTRELAALDDAFATTLARLKEGRLLRDGALVVIAGPPNAGKSSLLNALLGENRAIVSPVAGTTRDVIEAWLDLDGWPVRLVDTAGLRATDDAIEGEGVRRAQALIAEADVVVRLVPPEAAEAGEAVQGAQGNEIVVWSKGDLQGARTPGRQDTRTPGRQDGGMAGRFWISALTGLGLEDLRAAISGRLAERAAAGGETGTVPDRALAAVVAARAALPTTMEDLVLAGNALARAAETLGAPLGAVYGDDLLSALFSRFCVGK